MKKPTLKQVVTECIDDYLTALEESEPSNMHQMVTSEVEAALYACVYKYSGYNQLRSAQYLGISRGTLRKKLKLYNLID